MRREKIEMQKNFNAEGLYAGVAEVVDKGETSHTESVDPIKSIQ
jgi:MFS transporter, SP family, solute carrier family 2 (myo-inositol transporter), member 13